MKSNGKNKQSGHTSDNDPPKKKAMKFLHNSQ